ncbi:MAG: glycosyltransferase family 4 protein [Flavobacteriales bacterium]|nr:glycosyltransferase family 4 protein [Flavobacteriales bacterium]
MHLVLCTDGIHPHALGGMQKHSRLLAEHLARNGQVELTVIHPHARGVFDASLGIREVPVPPIDEQRIYYRELKAYSARVGAKLAELKPDAILTQGLSVWHGVERFSDRLVVHPHGLEMFQAPGLKERLLTWPFRRAMRHVVRHSRFAISLGGRLTPMLQRIAAGSSCQVVVIPNAVELPANLQPPTSYQPSTINLLFVGRFAFNKGLDVLLEVTRRLVREGREKDISFQLAGDGPLMAVMRDEGMPANVELLGRVDDAGLAGLYAKCDALVLPTRFEGMPTVVLEAMAHAKPILVSDVGATAELVDAHNGWLLPAGDTEALYRAIMELGQQDDAARQRMGSASRLKVEERFTWEAVTRQYADLLGRMSRR